MQKYCAWIVKNGRMLLCSFIATFMVLQVMIKVIKSHASGCMCKSNFFPPIQNLVLYNELGSTLNNCFSMKHHLLATGKHNMMQSLISFNNLEIRILVYTKGDTLLKNTTVSWMHTVGTSLPLSFWGTSAVFERKQEKWKSSDFILQTATYGASFQWWPLQRHEFTCTDPVYKGCTSI